MQLWNFWTIYHRNLIDQVHSEERFVVKNIPKIIETFF